MKAIGQSLPHVTLKAPLLQLGCKESQGTATLQEGAHFFLLYTLLTFCSHCWEAKMAVTVQENVQHLLKWYHFLHLFPLAVAIPQKKKSLLIL